jgi:uncharacterized protein (DUF952 family)
VDLPLSTSYFLPILHITPLEDWQAAQMAGVYTAVSLTNEGFIHCSLPNQVVRVANALYHGQPNLILLVIDHFWLDEVPLVYEDCYETGEYFPHVYGPIPLTAVVQTHPFPCQPDGSFTLPPALQPLL